MPEALRERAPPADPRAAPGPGTGSGGGGALSLASDEAAYINGAELPIDGGMHLTATVLGSRRDLGGGERPVSVPHPPGPRGVLHAGRTWRRGTPRPRASSPYTRGIRAARRGSWIQRGLSGEGDARHSNAQLQALLAQGQTGVDVIGGQPPPWA